MISYTTTSATFAYPQFIYDSDQATIDASHPTVRLGVMVPPCYFQVDLVFGSTVFNEVINADSNYSNLKLGSPYGVGSRSDGPYGGDADGTTPCLPKPRITYQNACDGTFTATLANDNTANVDAVFIVAGQRVHVRPGDAVRAQRHSGSLSIRDSTFTTHIASWEKPASCGSTPLPASSSPPPTAAASGPAVLLPPSSAPSSSLAATYDPGVPIDTGTAPASSAAAAAPASDSGSSGTLIIVLGVVLMLAGLVILVRVLRTFRRA